MSKLLSDDDVFGSASKQGGLLSDDDVFGTPDPKQDAKKTRSVGDVIRDVGVTALKGAVGLPQSFVGLADIPSGGRVGKALEEIGYRPDEAQKFLDEQYSEATKADKKYVQEADGFVDTVERALERPATIATSVGESIPSMIGGAGIARGVIKVAPKVAPVVAGAIGEGTIGAGQAAEQIRAENKDRLLTPVQQLAALGSGGVTGLLGFAGGKLAQRMGIGDIDTILASGKGQATAKGFARQVLESGVSEGVFEELPQSAQEQMWQNFATGKPIMDGVENAAAMGMLAGAAMGGAGGGYNAAISAKKTDSSIPNGDGATNVPPNVPGEQSMSAADVLGTPEPTEAEKALYQPRTLTALDRVNEIDRQLPSAEPEQAQQLQQERDSITTTWPTAVRGAESSFSTEAGARVDSQYALMEADDLVTSHDANLRVNPMYPQELQPRERDRAASEMQVSGIVQKLDPARLGESADAANGAPIVGADGLVESGNARTIALKRVYQANGQKANDYKQFVADNAARFGITPESVQAMQKPVLVRVRTTPVDRAEFARQANASTVAQMSSSEQAKADAARIDDMADLVPDDQGDFANADSREFVRRFMTKLPGTEQAGMIDANGQLSQTGYARVRNAVLAKAYGDSPVLMRMVESMDDHLRNVTKALMRVAPQVAKARQAIGDGALFDADITPDLMAAVAEMAKLKEDGRSINDALAQQSMFGGYSQETRDLLAFLDENVRRPRAIADFILQYFEALNAAGNPNQGSLLDDNAAPAKGDLLTAAKRVSDGQQQSGRNEDSGQEGRGKSQDAQGGESRAQGNGASGQESEWVAFPKQTGTLGIPRAEMPQIKGDHRGALIAFLKGKGIDYVTEDIPAADLKPTQAEFSVKKAEKWGEVRDGADRSVLASSDGYILDGHHQWVAALVQNDDVKAIHFDAPIKELLAEVFQFPSTQRGEGAKTTEGRQKAREDFDAALADLGSILRGYVGVARMIPENTPGLVPTLVKLFESGIREVGYNIKDLIAHVKKAARSNATTKPVWNKIDDEIYRKAARQAIDNVLSNPQAMMPPVQADLFAAPAVPEKGEQMDLFGAMSQAAPSLFNQDAKAETITLDGEEYHLDAPNFGAGDPPMTLKHGDPLLVETKAKPLDSLVDYSGISITRSDLHRIITEDHFVGKSPVPEGQKPIAYVMGGGGASGKGSVKSMLVKQGLIDESNAVALDPDDIKQHIPEYFEIIKAGDSRAVEKVHEESSDLSKAIKAKAISGRYNLLLDVTLGDQAKGKKYLQELKDAGYEVRLFGVTVMPELAVIRAVNRAKKTNRWVPIKHLLLAHKQFNGAFEDYAKIVDMALLFDNTTDRKEIAALVDGKLVVSNQEAYNGIAERSQINERAETLREIGRAERDERSGTRSREDTDGGRVERPVRPVREAGSEAGRRGEPNGSGRLDFLGEINSFWQKESGGTEEFRDGTEGSLKEERSSPPKNPPEQGSEEDSPSNQTIHGVNSKGLAVEQALEDAWAGRTGAITPLFSRGNGTNDGMAIRDLKAVVDRVSSGFNNLPRVHVLESPSALAKNDPAQKSLRDFIRKAGAWDDVEGATHEGEIYLFASGLADEERAEHVFATHEITHYGLRGSIGKDLDKSLQHIWLNNTNIRKAASERRRQFGMSSNIEATEEVLADMTPAELVKLTGWRKVVKSVRDWLQERGLSSLSARIDAWIKRGMDDQQKADLYVADLVNAARNWVRNGKGSPYVSGTMLADGLMADDAAKQESWLTREARSRGYQGIDDLAERNYPLFEKLATMWRDKKSEMPRFSRAAPDKSVAQRAEEIIQKSSATWRPVDAVIRSATKSVRLDALTRNLYDKAGALIDRLTPEDVKAGVISDYGLPEAVIDQRVAMQGKMRVQLRQTGDLLEKLSMLTRAESRVAYEWMNNADPQAASFFEDQLPPESLDVMGQVKGMIDRLSQEAVNLGQLDMETFKRNRFEYLRRSYIKHSAELTKGETESRRRAIAILGDQYKGRGMTDAVDMAKFKNIAPEWWNRKLKNGQADKQLRGEKFVRLERRQAFGAGVMDLEQAAGPGETNRQQKGRLLEVIYWPANEAIPAKFSTWEHAGTWEVRDTKGGKLVVWRDFTKQERVTMGEIDEARYAIAKTLHGMIHDVETGRYLEWLANTYSKQLASDVPGDLVEASERMRDTFKPGEWVQVPETKIAGTQVLKYGKLAGRYVPGPIWNDVRQTVGFRFKPLGETYAAILSAWKTAKTALSPAVHTNNVMANFVMADWHDVTAGHIAKALRIILGASQREGRGLIGRTGNGLSRAGMRDAEAAREIINRYQESGASLGSWVTAEIQKDQLEPLLEAMEKELGTLGETQGGQVGVMVALQKALQLRFPSAWEAFKPTAAGKAIRTEAGSLIDLYEAEDQVFRLAAWLRAKEEGASDIAAGKVARRSFLDYHINAPWVQAMRNTAFPFISFTYRSIPMLLEVAAKKPHKILKLAMFAGALNALGYMLSGGDEDDERKLLPEEKAGSIWGMVPKLVRLPWNSDLIVDGNKTGEAPVFLDIRRFVPVGDIFDTGQNHAAIPLLPFAVPGGPLSVMSELVANKSQFTGKAITKETDTPAEKAAKVVDHLYKAFAPNIIVLPGTYAFSGVVDARSGRTDSFGREQSVTQAIGTGFGIKVGSYPDDVLTLNAKRAAEAKMMEIESNITQLKREYARNGMTADEFARKVDDQNQKKLKIANELQEKFTPTRR